MIIGHHRIHSLFLRIPGWCQNYKITGKEGAIVSKGYLQFSIAQGDDIIYSMEMEPRRIYEDPRVSETNGRVAIGRGPLVYCAEEFDNPDLLPSEYFHCDLSLHNQNHRRSRWYAPCLQGI